MTIVGVRLIITIFLLLTCNTFQLLVLTRYMSISIPVVPLQSHHSVNLFLDHVVQLISNVVVHDFFTRHETFMNFVRSSLKC